MSKLGDFLAGALDPVRLARRVGMDCDPWQIDALRAEDDRLALNIHRQGGKSTVAALKALHRATYSPGSLVLIASPSQRQSSELFRKVLVYYRALGRPVSPESENQLSLTLENGSRIISVPGTEANIRGYSVDLLIVDEAARVPDDLWSAVSPMLAVTRGQVVAMSTPWGRRGWWWGATGSAQWRTITVPAIECPRITPEWLADERASIGDFWYRQEYLCEFLDAAGQMFATDDIAAIFGEYFEPRRELPSPMLALMPATPDPSVTALEAVVLRRDHRRERRERTELERRARCHHIFGLPLGDGSRWCEECGSQLGAEVSA